MFNDRLDYWKKFFYSPEGLLNEMHGKQIKVKNTEQLIDLQRIHHLIRAVFQTHLNTNPQKIDINSIRRSTSDSSHYYINRDITNLFITSYYEYPPFFSNTFDLSSKDEINSRDVLNEIRGEIADPGGIVILVGEIGEGKSAFLRKIALELKYSKSAQEYFPVIIDLQKYNEIIERKGISVFWGKVYEYVINNITDELQMFIPDTIVIEEENQKGVISEVEGSLSAIFATAKTDLSQTRSTKHIEQISRKVGSYHQLKNIARKIKEEKNTRLVLIFDNLDTFCSEHERFMLFDSGYDQLKLKIETVKQIFWGATDDLNDTEISFIFTARPYVYNHVFQFEVQDIKQGEVNKLYSIGEIEPTLPIDLRLNMLIDLANKLDVGGKEKKIIEDYIYKLEEIKKLMIKNH